MQFPLQYQLAADAETSNLRIYYKIPRRTVWAINVLLPIVAVTVNHFIAAVTCSYEQQAGDLM
jgi:hypothetical protein